MTSRVRLVITLYWKLLAIATGTGSMTAVAVLWVHSQAVAPQYHHLIIDMFALAGLLVAGVGVFWVLRTTPRADQTAARWEARY